MPETDEPIGRDYPGQFRTTHWSVVLEAGDSASPTTREALERLCQAYWYPLYAYVRRKGYAVADAQDLTQQFFERFIEKHFLRSVSREKGRFRSFLLASLEHFLAKEWTRAHRLKRGGGQRIISWDEFDPEDRYRLEPADNCTAEKLYDRRWALTALEQALAELDREYTAAGKQIVFKELRPFLSGDDPGPSYAELAERLLMSEGAVRVALHRLRQRYGEAVRAEVAKVVQRPEDIDSELRHLLTALS
jgi:RNA polymerase sigma-70 factor (ECF subfamily)